MIEVEWIGACGLEVEFPKRRLPEIALVGRSNVGKSSLINHFLQRKKIAKVSSTPGKTQTINFFLVNDAFFLVDLPGYGFAKAPIALQQKWCSLVDHYIQTRDTLRLLLFLVDSRYPPSKEDALFFTWASQNSAPILLVITKIDTLPKCAVDRKVSDAVGFFRSLAPNYPFEYVSYSIYETEGRRSLWQRIEKLLHTQSELGGFHGTTKK
ncbi:MAG: ribosome biogenesis GTP-binding protein YihA/YsxC [Chlamydiota bacterium]